MIKSFVCVCGLLVSLNVVAASLKPVKGKVVDRFNNPLPGATIQVTHSPEKTITDVDGNFNFETIEDAELIVSYIGFRTLKLKTAGENFIHVVLDEDSQLLNDVVVVGYSTITTEGSDTTYTYMTAIAAWLTALCSDSYTCSHALQSRRYV